MLEKIGSTYPGRPVVVEASQAQLDEFQDLLAEYRVVVGPATVDALVGAVDSLSTQAADTGRLAQS